MDLPQAVNTRLLAASAVTNLVGTRINWVRRDQGGALPAVVLNAAGGSEDYSLDDNGDIVTSRIRANCLAGSHSTAWAVAEAVGDALRDEGSASGFLFWEADVFRPIDLGGESVGGVFIHEAVVEIVLRHSAAT